MNDYITTTLKIGDIFKVELEVTKLILHRLENINEILIGVVIEENRYDPRTDKHYIVVSVPFEGMDIYLDKSPVKVYTDGKVEVERDLYQEFNTKYYLVSRAT